MNPPDDLRLPFFAYGVFRPGELAFLQIKALVANCSDSVIRGVLRVRDGLPIASLAEAGNIHGILIEFHSGRESEAYRRVIDLEPDAQYFWKIMETSQGKANVLAGRSPQKGSVYAEGEWSGRKDPLFTVALDVVAETLDNNREFKWDLKPLFRLEMAYLLLWSAIERYASLRYHLGDKATKKVLQLADETAFRDALKLHVRQPREVQRADDPTEKCILDASDPRGALGYYYQVRSNLVHRGKGVPRDHDRLRDSVDELLAIFRATLDAAFMQSKWPTDIV